jgi:arginyl-tRNA synthetase
MSYNMVDLPSGKMKSREGTVVDADDIIEQTIHDAEMMTRELGKLENFDDAAAHQLYKTVGMGALKFFILKVDPEKRMLFNPAESIDINGFTGPFVQYTYARTQSVMRKANTSKTFSNQDSSQNYHPVVINHREKELIKHILSYAEIIQEAATKLSPALIANYTYELAKTYNQFYHDCVVVDEQQVNQSFFRIQLTRATGQTIKSAFGLLGIDVPDRM